MRKSLLVLVGLALMAGSLLFFAGCGKKERVQTLIISQWGFNMDLLEKNLIAPFEKKYGVKVEYELGNNAERLTKLLARKDNPVVDVALLSGSFALQAMDEGLFLPYDPEKIPNLNKILPAGVDPLGGRSAVGYTITHMGLFYRSDKTAPITTWRDLSRPELQSFISLPDMGTTYGPAVVYMLSKAWGSGFNDTETGWAKLAELSPALKTSWNNNAELNSLTMQEEIYVSPYTSFGWGQLEDTGHPVVSVIPEEGLTGIFNVAGIIKGTKNVDLAHAFIDFLLSHEVQYAQAMALVESPVNVDVILPPEVGSKLTYGDDIINNLVFFDEQEIAANRADWITRWNRVRSK